MERLNRDLIILGRIDKLDENVIKQEVLYLNSLLNLAEMSDERYKTFEFCVYVSIIGSLVGDWEFLVPVRQVSSSSIPSVRSFSSEIGLE